MEEGYTVSYSKHPSEFLLVKTKKTKVIPQLDHCYYCVFRELSSQTPSYPKENFETYKFINLQHFVVCDDESQYNIFLSSKLNVYPDPEQIIFRLALSNYFFSSGYFNLSTRKYNLEKTALKNPFVNRDWRLVAKEQNQLDSVVNTLEKYKGYYRRLGEYLCGLIIDDLVKDPKFRYQTHQSMSLDFHYPSLSYVNTRDVGHGCSSLLLSLFKGRLVSSGLISPLVTQPTTTPPTPTTNTQSLTTQPQVATKRLPTTTKKLPITPQVATKRLPTTTNTQSPTTQSTSTAKKLPAPPSRPPPKQDKQEKQGYGTMHYLWKVMSNFVSGKKEEPSLLPPEVKQIKPIELCKIIKDGTLLDQENLKKLLDIYYQRYDYKENQVNEALMIILSTFIETAKHEIKCDAGRMDIVTTSSIIEIKRTQNWRTSLGQVLDYSIDMPDKRRIVVLFDRIVDNTLKNEEQKLRAYRVCQHNSVECYDFGIILREFLANFVNPKM